MTNPKCKKPKQTESKKADKEPKKETKSDGRANAAESDSESDCAWILEDDDNNSVASDDSLPDLSQISDSEDDDEAYTGFEDWEAEEQDWFCDTPHSDNDKEVVAKREEDAAKNLGYVSGEALVTTDSSKPTHRIKLYDSGCTNHISPFCEHFENYIDISLKRFQAANQQTFDAIGRGELVIDVPWLQILTTTFGECTLCP